MDNPVLPPLDEIDWDKLVADFTPPEWDLLLSAASKNDWLAVRHLVENEGVPITHSNGMKQTALHISVLWGHIETSRYLIENGADVNAANALFGATPLHMMLNSHRISGEQQTILAHLLVDEGKADPLKEDARGKAPIEYITREQRKSHPLFQDEKHAALLKKMTPPPPSKERIRANFISQITNDRPLCAPVVAPKKSSARKA